MQIIPTTQEILNAGNFNWQQFNVKKSIFIHILKQNGLKQVSLSVGLGLAIKCGSRCEYKLENLEKNWDHCHLPNVAN